MPARAEGPLPLFIVHWNRPVECVQTVRALSAQAPMRVVVVDNASETNALAAIEREIGKAVEIVRLPANRGWGGALNVVLKKWLALDREPFCLISAHDAAPGPNCIPLLLAAANADPRAGIVCPQYPDGIVPRLSGLRGVFYEHETAGPAGSARQVDVPHGTLMLLRRECLQDVGLFDERYFAYGDEHELGARAATRGWKNLMVWGAVVTNPGTWTASSLRSYFFARNSLLLVRDYFTAAHAFARAILLLVNTLRLLLAPRSEFAFSARARLAAVRDYFAGRFGIPDWAR